MITVFLSTYIHCGVLFMYLGIVCALLTATLQPISYLLSRLFFVRGGRTLELTIYSYTFMGLLSVFLLFSQRKILSFEPRMIVLTLFCMLTILTAQLFYFFAVKVVEASRLSSMLGLKIIFLVFLNMLLFSQSLGFLHWLAVLLCASAGLIMNRSGLSINMKSLLAILCCCFFLAASDIADFSLVSAVTEQASPLQKGIIATAYCYIGLGIVFLPGLFFIKLDRKKFITTIPYSLVWLLAMVFFYLSVGLLGTVFTSIIQSSRGLISVLLGALFSYLGYVSVESKADKKTWIARATAAIMIMLAAIIFTCIPA